ncbi:MAG TPA: hypothetical protein VHC72_19630, partial [Bryobacteraceae bacterium]|nr:hypothetical protein [Bryobacteraceae bacterium]
MSGAWRQYTVLVLFLMAAIFQEGKNFSWAGHVLTNAEAVPAAPFTIQTGTRTISNGPLAGDQILALNGHPFTAKRQYDDAVFRAHPGDPIHLVVSEPSGRATEKTVFVRGSGALTSSTANIALTICISVFIPLVCFGLGFAVALIRPKDPNAWLLLFLLLGFDGVFNSGNGYGPWPDFDLLWASLSDSFWRIALLLFGIYFPARLRVDRRHPWIKYALVIPAAAVSLADWAIVWVWTHRLSAAAFFEPYRAAISGTNRVLHVGLVVAFLFLLALHSRETASADEVRRLRILRMGTLISLAPMLGVLLYATVRHRQVLAGAPWHVETFAISMLALFPVTLAYVIVVERAMDLRFVVRQSVRYGFARGTLWLVRAFFIGLAVYVLTNRVGKVIHPAIVLSAIVGVIVVRRRNMERASVWLDKKFFREAYDAELLLSELALEAGRYVEIEPLLETVGRRIGNTLHVDDIVIMVREGDCYRTRYSTRNGEPMDIPVESHLLTLPGSQNEPLQVFLDKPQPWMRALDTTELQTLAYMKSEVLLTLRGGSQGGETMGIMSLGPKKSGASYSKTDLRLLQAIAVQTGMALQNSRLASSLAAETAQREAMNRELSIAHEVQERLF